MKLKSRLLTCALMVQPGNVAADIGTDHGYLPIYLLETGICPRVLAADVREMPLEAARRSAARAGITAGIDFYLSDGLKNLPAEEYQTVICAGMGGDCIIGILERAKAQWSQGYQWILQPQSSVSDLRRWLDENGFSILREKLARDGKFIYTVMEVRFGGRMDLSVGEQFFPMRLFDPEDPLLKQYYGRVTDSLSQTVNGLTKTGHASPEIKGYYETALQQVRKVGEQYGLCE